MKVKITKGEYYIHLPKQLYVAITNLPEADGIDTTFLALLVDFIIQGDLKDDNDSSGWVHLYSGILKKYNYTENGKRYIYANHLNFLKEYQIIKGSTSYSTSKKKSKSYRIIRHILDIEVEAEKMELHPQLSKLKINYHRSRKQLAERKTPHLTKSLDDEGFVLNKVAALVHAEELYNNNEIELKSYKSMCYAIRDLDNKGYSRDGSDDRLHTKYTNMPKKIRQFISYKGEKMVGYDIKSSQPLMLSCMLEMFIQEYNELKAMESVSQKALSNKISKRLKRWCENHYTTTIKDRASQLNKEYISIDYKDISDSISTIMCLNGVEQSYFEGIACFIKLIRDGDIYNHVAGLFLDNGIITEEGGKFCVQLYDCGKQVLRHFDSLRDCGKLITINSIYSAVDTTVRAVKEFKALFPEVFELLDAIKGGKRIKVKRGQVASDTPKLHSRLALMLQRMEAKFILDYCTKMIAKKYPETPLITIHDSIATSESHASLLKKEFESCLMSYFGIDILLVAEPW